MELQKIGEGYTAEVYTWREKEILKLFRKEFPLGGIEKEYRTSKAVEKLGLPIPKVGAQIEYEGRTGIIYEKIAGKSLLKLISDQPWNMQKNIKKMAAMHYEMHQCKAEGLQSVKASLRWNINQVKDISESQRQEVLRQLDQLPDGDFLCHGDYHPGNIMKDGNRYVILDWMTAVAAVPGYDVARTIYLLRDAAMPGDFPKSLKFIMKLGRKSMSKNYLKHYIKLSGISKEELEGWRLSILTARLMEWIPESERTDLLKEINEKTGVK